MTTGSDLKERIQVQCLLHYPEADAFAWEVSRNIWAAAEQDARSNLFSSAGTGARGVTFTLRRNPELTIVNSFLWRGRFCLTLHNAFRWRGQFCFLTAIEDGEPGFQVVKAALREPLVCVQDADMEPVGCTFPGILTEKYAGHQQLEPHAEVTGDFVLVTPKMITLAPGSWVTVGGAYYLGRVPHELEPCRNEYEIRRKEDC